jgi:hypothetical protein
VIINIRLEFVGGSHKMFYNVKPGQNVDLAGIRLNDIIGISYWYGVK